MCRPALESTESTEVGNAELSSSVVRGVCFYQYYDTIIEILRLYCSPINTINTTINIILYYYCAVCLSWVCTGVVEPNDRGR